MTTLNDSKIRRTKGELKVYKQNLYFSIISDISNGLNPKQISVNNKKSEQNINHYIAVLKKYGYIRKIGYGTWELTKKAEIERTKGFLWGSQRSDFKIELWRLGYRFLIEHDNPIKALKPQILRSGGKVHKGKIMDCWVMKGKKTLDIYGTVAKSDNLWDASVIALTQVIACKGYIEDTYHLLLRPIEPLRPDIIINTPETREIAEKVSLEMGRMRTEYFDVGDCSKTGKPEFEAKTLEKAQNVIDNLGIDNKADLIISALNNLNPVLISLSEQIRLHLDATREWRDMAKDIRDILRKRKL